MSLTLAAAAPAPIVQFRGVRKSYDAATPAVRDLSLDVVEGEFLTLLGPKGAGKTTTLMLLAGFERPDAGDILIDGRTALRMPPQRRGIGVVFQSHALFPGMTVNENVAFGLRVRGIHREEREARVKQALQMVRMTAIGDRRPVQLSLDQQQRVALARALAFRPRLVVLDEPLGALDRQAREEMQLELRRIQRKLKVTMVHATLDQAEALTLSDRIAVMRDGVIRQVGTPLAIYDYPADHFVARYVGESNRFAGYIEAVEDGLARVRLACGGIVESRMSGVSNGHRCMVSVRPERIAVAAVTAEEMGDGALPGVVQEVIFQGTHARLRLLVGAPGAALVEVAVKRPAGAPLRGMGVGEAVSIAWQGHHAMAFEPDVGT